MPKMLTKEQINKGFTECIHCSQQVLAEWAEKLGYDRDAASRMAAPFGGGMFRGDTCGAVSGAMIAIGTKYGHCKPGDADGNAAMMEKVAAFQKEFIARNGSTICRELVGHDFSKEGELEKAMENGKVFEICPKLVQSSLEILNEIM
jgi:C_GCAxxG_C_C family probable redox protein